MLSNSEVFAVYSPANKDHCLWFLQIQIRFNIIITLEYVLIRIYVINQAEDYT